MKEKLPAHERFKKSYFSRNRITPSTMPQKGIRRHAMKAIEVCGRCQCRREKSERGWWDGITDPSVVQFYHYRCVPREILDRHAAVYPESRALRRAGHGR